ncbi:hypothetical protein L0664_00480 [Octadecabacter sp. G9-8]|uniref:ATP-binding protein n=1 Tax=Octadecabacter dasysiphoniae TaxID=2909341 RepID=A0ABS9CQL0_9RHOB|nr:hypothetical protein [Octadecabacter dasysiphoniae]MCF2869526.1 hypothetical protein [Octadecabacter dasysiphoniae]
MTHQESFGAFLVSGQRGAGKTSFVHYCLEEYRKMAFQRSIRISQNSAAYSVVLFLGFCAIVVSTYVLLTQALELGAQNVFEAILAMGIGADVGVGGFASAAVVWWIFPFLFGSIFMLLPLFFALRTPRAISELCNRRTPKLGAYFLSLGLILTPTFLWIAATVNGLTFRLDTIVYSMLWFIIPLAAMAQIIHSVAATRRVKYRGVGAMTVFAIILSLVLAVLNLLNLPNDENGADLSDLALIFAACLVSVWAFKPSLGDLKFGKLCRGIGITIATILLASVIFLNIENDQSSLNLWGPFDKADQADRLLATVQISPLLIFAVLLAVFYLFFTTAPKADDDPMDRSYALPMGPVKTILVFKGGFFVLLTFVGILPALRVILGWFYLSFPGVSGHLFQMLPPIASSHASYLTVFILIALVIVIYATEYAFICRDLRSHRQDSAITLLGRSNKHPTMPDAWYEPDAQKAPKDFGNALLQEPGIAIPRPPFINAKSGASAHPMTAVLPLDDRDAFVTSRLSARRRFVFRQLEMATLPHLVYSVRHPVLPVWINLGFDNLEHSRIIEAMLRRLRGLYQSQFLSLRGAVGILNAFLLVAVTVLFTSVVSKSIFHVGHISAIDRPEGYKYRFETAEAGIRPIFGETNYCGFFEVYPDVAPNVKSTICALPFNNAIMELLYSPVLQIHTDFSSNIVPLGKQFDRLDETRVPLSGAAALARCASSPDFDAAKAAEKPLTYFDWSACLPTASPNYTGDIWGLLPAQRTFEIWAVSPPSPPVETNWKLDPPAQHLHDHFMAASNDVALNLRSASDVRSGAVDLIARSFGLAENFLGTSANATRSAGTNAESISLVRDSELVHYILDQNYGLPRINFETPTSNYSGLSLNTFRQSQVWYDAYSPFGPDVGGPPTLRVYHLLLYFLGFWMFFTINRRLAVLPYQSNLDSINELILLINGRETLRSGDKEPQGWLAWVLPFRRPERMVETASDPRVVEQRLIELLYKLRPNQQSARSGLPNVFEIRPEITFIFDEMDKLSGIVDAELSKDAAGQTQMEENNRERARSLQLHQLLSDMKRLISGNSARFIFIGGRLYHDEWLADQAQRAPILNSIFNGQIYLPSLMADRRHPYGRFNDRVTELVTLMYRNAQHRLNIWINQRNSDVFPESITTEEPTYAQFNIPFSAHPQRLASLSQMTGMRVIAADGKNYSATAGRWRADLEHTTNAMSAGEQETLDQFINFLTYRSAGNPKKLKELIQGLVLPSSMALAAPRYPHGDQQKVRWGNLAKEGHDMIMLNDSAIYRMQFIDMLYRHLSDHMEARMLDRDDKVSMSIFYLMDFLMKFHNRGFSRTNLQRVDELSHIHRAPDLRSVMGALVQVSSERFLHRVLNGVYNFRFRSDFAREIDYLSRISKEEMAALNFTLDESQSLKGLYQQTINTGERENIDTIAGLGELYEYDQEYEIARNYYRRAITMLDNVQMETLQSRAVRQDVQTKTFQPISHGYAELRMLGDILISDNEDHKRKLLLSQIHWIVARVRLMLQVGQTYEQEMNFERANATFTHTTQLCDEVFRSLSNARNTDDKSKMFMADQTISDIDVNNFPILFQAGIAAAWVQEKDPENIDQSVVFGENWLQRIYEREPILQVTVPSAEDYSFIAASSGGIFVQVALCHDRIGDLYFMKGRQSFKTTKIEKIIKYVEAMGKPASNKAVEADGTITSRRAGYVDKAHYHYAAAAWMLRKFLTHRFRISGKSWHVVDDDHDGIEVLDRSGVAPSHFHSTVADVLTDLSEAIYAKRSSVATAIFLLKEENPHPSTKPTTVKLTALRLYQKYRRRLLNDNVDRFVAGFILPEGASSEVTDQIWGNWFGDLQKTTEDILNHSTNPIDPHNVAKLLAFEEDESVFNFLDSLEREKNPISRWIGTRNSKSMQMDPKKAGAPNVHFDEPMVKFTPPGGPFAQLEAYTFFGQAAARASQRIGQSTNASNEYLMHAEAMITTLWEARQIRFIKNLNIDQWPGYRAFFADLTDDRDLFLNQRTAARIALSAFSSLKDAMERIQFSERPSASRMSRNHGNPKDTSKTTTLSKDLISLEEKLRLAQNALLDIRAASFQSQDFHYLKRIEISQYEIANTTAQIEAIKKELEIDYDLAQAFRDDPRPITQACSLILALLQDDTGLVNTGIALLVYKDILCRYAGDTFDLRYIDPHHAAFTKSDKVLLRALDQKDTDELKRSSMPRLKAALVEHCYAGLKTILERSRFPVLNRLQGLRILSDALVMSGDNRDAFRKAFGCEKDSELGRLTRELVVTADVYGSETHFPANAIGTTAALLFLYMHTEKIGVLYDDMTENRPMGDLENAYYSNEGSELDPTLRPLLSEVSLTREAIGELAINKLNRSQETCAMGDAYYENIAYLYTLNDDFNDRFIHFTHAKNLASTDLSEVLALMVKSGFKQGS